MMLNVCLTLYVVVSWIVKRCCRPEFRFQDHISEEMSSQEDQPKKLILRRHRDCTSLEEVRAQKTQRHAHWNCHLKNLYTENFCCFVLWNTRNRLTPSTPTVPNCCCSKGPAPYWSNPPFLMFDIRALSRECQSARMSKIKNGGLDEYGKV